MSTAPVEEDAHCGQPALPGQGQQWWAWAPSRLGIALQPMHALSTQEGVLTLTLNGECAGGALGGRALHRWPPLELVLGEALASSLRVGTTSRRCCC